MTTYNKAFEDGMEYERTRVMAILSEAVDIGTKRIPRNEAERHERNAGLELIALLTYRICDGMTAKEAGVQLQKDLLKETKKKGENK